MPREKYQTRLAADHAEQVDQFAAERDISESEAVRRLIRAGLEAEQEPDHPQPQYEDTLSINKTTRLAGGGIVAGATIGLLIGAFLL